MLENSMVLPSASPSSPFDYLRPEREESCIICKTTACLVSDGWYADTNVADDGGIPYLEGYGREFVNASDTPHGWVCSKACRSQAMYEHASDSEKRNLIRVRDACRILVDYGKQILNVVEEVMDHPSLTDNLVDGANEFLETIADGDCSEWCNQETREERLEQAIFETRIATQLMASQLGIEAISRMKDGHTWAWQVEQQAVNAATCGNIALKLKAIEEEKR